jgi:haloacetate dehalogenase
MSLWGADLYAVGKMFDLRKVWQEMASNLVTHAIRQCGHLPHEEQAEVVTRLLVEFLQDWKGGRSS